jgi:hypothetical protein
MQVVVGVTNQSSNGKPMTLARELMEKFNARAELQGADGVVAEDLTEGWFGSGYFNLRARSAGLEASGAAVRFTATAGLTTAPGGDFVPLQHNLSDLQPRAHVLVRSGLRVLSGRNAWDTRRVEDGFHELTAVGYEGSHVQTPSRISLPVEVRNSALRAEVVLSGTHEVRSLGVPLLVQVTANTNLVSAIRLYSTGGLIGMATDQGSAKFTVAAASLGTGRHPIYAVVDRADGRRFRTQTWYVRLGEGY